VCDKYKKKKCTLNETRTEEDRGLTRVGSMLRSCMKLGKRHDGKVFEENSWGAGPRTANSQIWRADFISLEGVGKRIVKAHCWTSHPEAVKLIASWLDGCHIPCPNLSTVCWRNKKTLFNCCGYVPSNEMRGWLWTVNSKGGVGGSKYNQFQDISPSFVDTCKNIFLRFEPEISRIG